MFWYIKESPLTTKRKKKKERKTPAHRKVASCPLLRRYLRRTGSQGSGHLRTCLSGTAPGPEGPQARRCPCLPTPPHARPFLLNWGSSPIQERIPPCWGDPNQEGAGQREPLPAGCSAGRGLVLPDPDPLQWQETNTNKQKADGESTVGQGQGAQPAFPSGFMAGDKPGPAFQAPAHTCLLRRAPVRPASCAASHPLGRRPPQPCAELSW